VALVLVTVATLWWTGSRARELAIGHARRRCEQDDLQFLDQTVALAGLALARTQQGVKCLERRYSFECTLQGIHRDQGEVIMRGYQLVRVKLPYTMTEDGTRVFLH